PTATQALVDGALFWAGAHVVKYLASRPLAIRPQRPAPRPTARPAPARPPAASGSTRPTLVNCFPPATLVATEAGLRPIAQVEPGERVWAYDFQGGVWRLCEVEYRHDANYDGPLVTIDIGVGEVTTTAYHP